jgi:hypothetical protein
VLDAVVRQDGDRSIIHGSHLLNIASTVNVTTFCATFAYEEASAEIPSEG